MRRMSTGRQGTHGFAKVENMKQMLEFIWQNDDHSIGRPKPRIEELFAQIIGRVTIK